jgi:membrane peptidoglycan carboxypeptidase
MPRPTGSHPPVTVLAVCHKAYPVSVLTSGLSGKIGVVGRLALLSAASGVLVAALVIPAVGVTGIAVRNEANKFDALSTPELGQLPVRSQILDDAGNVLAYYYPRGIDRVPVSFSQIAPVMRQAIVAIEDSRFYQHGAIDIKGTIRAFVNDFEHKPIQGGSTLAQQYVKNVLILSAANPQKEAASATGQTLSRKIRELRMAVVAEHKMSKESLLAGYLNVAYFGNQSYGIQVAAQHYFSVPAAELTLPQAALLAGMVENPARYDPSLQPTLSEHRRNVVLTRMLQVGDITKAQEKQAEATPVSLHISQQQTGCTSDSAAQAAFYCDYTLAVMQHDAAFSKAWNQLQGKGGLTIYTTLDGKDQQAANNAVNYMLPPPPSADNPGADAAAEVLIQPGTGYVRAIANNRPYGNGAVDYAVDSVYNGAPEGVQTGSSSKIFTLLTALEQGVPFGYVQTVPAATTVTGYTDCAGAPAGDNGSYPLINDSPSEKGAYTLYLATAQSVNIYFAELEKKVGLCNVVKMASRLGDHWVTGQSLLQSATIQGVKLPPADATPSFTLGAINVSPMTMAAAYATVASRGIYCHPVAITKIVNGSGAQLPVESAGCHRVLSTDVADAASYVLQSVLTIGTAGGLGIGRPAAGKTGTSDNFAYAAFGGYTPDLTGYVSVFYPLKPNTDTMASYPRSCYRVQCDGAGMFGADAPAHIWQMTFLHAKLASNAPNFVFPTSGQLFSMGNGQTAPKPPKPTSSPSGGPGGGGGNGGGGNGGGGGGPSPAPTR